MQKSQKGKEIKENPLAYFGAQNRAVTAQDYQVRCLAMPSKFGSVAKAFVIQDSKLDANSPAATLASPDNQEEFIKLIEKTKQGPVTPSRQARWRIENVLEKTSKMRLKLMPKFSFFMLFQKRRKI